MTRDRRDVEDRVRSLLEAFRMKRALDVLASVLPADKPGRTQSLETFERLLRAELDDRRERRIARRLDDSHLPDRPTLETFDFAFQPKDLIAFDGMRFQVLSLPEQARYPAREPLRTADELESSDPATLRQLLASSPLGTGFRRR
jgi:hypothetical protein